MYVCVSLCVSHSVSVCVHVSPDSGRQSEEGRIYEREMVHLMKAALLPTAGPRRAPRTVMKNQ